MSLLKWIIAWSNLLLNLSFLSKTLYFHCRYDQYNDVALSKINLGVWNKRNMFWAILNFDKEFVFPNNLYHDSKQRCCKWHCMCSTCLLMVHVLSKVSFPPYPPIMWDKLSCIFATERLKYDVTRNTRSTKSNDILNTLATYLVNLRACLNYFNIFQNSLKFNS